MINLPLSLGEGKVKVEFTLAAAAAGKKEDPVNGQVFVTFYGTLSATEAMPVTPK